MKLYLYHGRKTVDEDMDDWGFEGPTIEDINYLHDTYCNLTVSFRTRAAMMKAVEVTGWERADDGAYLLQIPIIDGLIKTKVGFFGDRDFNDDDHEFWCWRREVNMWAGTILGLRVEDIEGSEDMIRRYFDDMISAEAYVAIQLVHLGLDDIRRNGGWT